MNQSNLKHDPSRLSDLLALQILDTPAENEFDDLVFIAAQLFDAPLAHISFLDDHRQWFKSTFGFEADEMQIEDTFCQHAIKKPSDVLVVEDTLESERFKNHPEVTDGLKIRFYAGAPLTSKNGNVIGTLCLIDNKPRSFSIEKQQALAKLAEKVMKVLEQRKVLIEQNQQILLQGEQLERLTNRIPGVIFQFEWKKKGKLTIQYVSAGIKHLGEDITPLKVQESPEMLIDWIGQEQFEAMASSFLAASNQNQVWKYELKIERDGKEFWYDLTAEPELASDKKSIWYGTLQEITDRVQRRQELEQILFDISHVMRRPICSIEGLLSILKSETMSATDRNEALHMLDQAIGELDEYTRLLNDKYVERSSRFHK